MEKTIWKFVLTPETLKISMPEDSIILTAKEQGNEICIWAEVSPSKPLTVRYFEIFGTGHPIPCETEAGRKYIGTAFLYGGKLVFHVYEWLI